MQACWLVTEQIDLQWVENIDETADSALLNIQRYIDSSITDDRPLRQPEKAAVNFQSELEHTWDLWNVQPTPFPLGADLLSFTDTQENYSSTFLSICLSSRRFTDNLRVPQGCIHCDCSWFDRVPLLVSDVFITNVLHGNRGGLFSHFHNSHRMWGKALSCLFMSCLDVRWRWDLAGCKASDLRVPDMHALLLED